MKDQESRALSIIKDLTEYCKREYFEFYEALDVLIPRKVTRKKVREDKAVFNGGFFQDDDRGVFSTDGKYLLYDAELVNKNYKKNRYKSLVHHLMHVIMHLLLDDLQTYQNTANKRLYSAYADIRVEDILYILENPQNTQGEEISILDMHEVWKYRIWYFKSTHPSIPESYFTLVKDKRMRREMLRADIVYCDHSFWEKRADPSVIRKWEAVRAGLSDCGSVLNIAKNHGKDPINSLLYGDEEGRGGQRGRAAEKNSNTYIDVLKEFINVKERFLEDPESIDRNMYEYGLEMYGNVALIEPEEINEENCFDTIAIAIDTSGSCGGYTVNSFLRETSNLLRDISYNSSKGRIILYQCDSCIQKKDMIEDTEGIEDKVEDIDLFGFGGTSFVPVFDDLERYEAEGRGKVDALFYLTDGFGEYPTKAPGYKTFFILPGEGYDLSDDLIPDWIEGLRMKI